jgi:glycyl-tRNA synthetase alpha chain
MPSSRTFQKLVGDLKAYWAKKGCSLIEPYDLEKGAGTFNPATFFGSLTDKPISVAYVEPSRRPTDGRYGENPNRLSRYYQYQVILKPVPADVRKLYLDSLKAIGLDPLKHDVRWIEDDWESPTLGASGLGWEVRLDGMEVTQFTYFQQMAGAALKPVTCEITYGLERLAMYSQKKNNVYQLAWDETGRTYGDLHLPYEKQFSAYNFEKADVEMLRRHFDDFEKEAKSLLGHGLYLPAYDETMKCSHTFNLLDARGAISVAERAVMIGRVRGLAKKCAEQHLKLAGAA